MYRKANSQFGFRSLNLFGDLPGSLASSSGADPGTISLPQQDMVYLYQLQLSNPCALSGESLYVSKIIDTNAVSFKVFEKLQKLGLVDVNGEVKTAAFDNPKFGKDYTHALSIIPVSRQKQVVEFLFWWDEEARRLRKLMAEKEELLSMQATDQNFELLRLRQRVESKINTKPSARDESVEKDEDLAAWRDNQSADVLPTYS